MAWQWNDCLLCQDSRDEALHEGSYIKLSELLPEFAKHGKYDHLERFGANKNITPEELYKILDDHKAKYHRSCVSRFNKQKLERLLKPKNERGRPTSSDGVGESSSQKRRKRNEETIIRMNELKCLFCREQDTDENLVAAGTMHATKEETDPKHVTQFTKTLKEKALKLENSGVLSALAFGDVKTRQIYYHKQCLKDFNNEYAKALRREQAIQNEDAVSDLKKEIAFRRIINYVMQKRREDHFDCIEVAQFELMYKDLLEFDDIAYTCHVTHFTDKLLSVFVDAEKRVVNKKVVLCFSGEVDKIIKNEITNQSLAKCLFKVVAPIREQMENVKNTFDGSFPKHCQEQSCPALLQTLCSLLINGMSPHSKGVSQPALTVSQIIMHEFKKTRSLSKSESIPSHTRHVLHRETPLPRYVGLTLYTMRAKTTIQKMFHLGISISYERCLDICDGISLSLLKKYESDKVFVSNSMRKKLFTIVAKDNIDVNAKSTKVSSHYHGISFTIMQFMMDKNCGILQEKLYDLSEKLTRKLVLPEEYTEFRPFPFRTSTPLFYPKCNATVEKNDDYFKAALCEEIEWLDVISSSNSETCSPWGMHHSAKFTSGAIPGIHSMMPPIPKKVASVEAQYHCMTIIKRTIAFTNEGQIPVDVSDQPVFARSREVQIRYPSEFGNEKYVCLLGDLHIEQSTQVLHGLLIKGSGLEGVLSKSNLSTSGTSTIVDTNDLKRTRYCIQVSACSIYMLLKDSYVKSESHLSIFDWLDEKCKSSQMCFYWRMILRFQLQILIFVRSIRAGNFILYLQTLYQFLKWYFALDKYNYSRWATIYWYDLAKLQQTCPSVYNELMRGHFSFAKTDKPFSRMGLDQLHEQNNKVIKGISGATNLLNRRDESALNRWALSAPDLAQMIGEFEDIYQFQVKSDLPKRHHESSPTFQKDFYEDVLKVKTNFVNNPFELNELTEVTNTELLFDDNIYANLSTLEAVAETQLEQFITERLTTSKMALDAKISLNHFVLPGDDRNRKPRGATVDKRLSTSFLTKLRGALTYRRHHALNLFSTEIFGVAQSLSINDTTPYQGSKSTLLKRFSTCEIPTKDSSSAIIVELSPLLRTSVAASTFGEFSTKLMGTINRLSIGYDRVDIICDRYFEDSLKNQTREGRGSGEVMEFDKNTKFPSDFKDNFLKNSKNKDRLNEFLADEFMQHYAGDKTFVVTKGEHVLSNVDLLAADNSLSPNSAEEADQKLVRHALQCVRSGIRNVVIRTVDTDVILLLIAYRHQEVNTNSRVFACMAVGKEEKYYDINSISSLLGQEKCQALPFFHAVTGCDSTSYFFNQGKCKFWDRWEEFSLKDELTSVFGQLGRKPSTVTDEQALLLEKYVSFVYHNSELEDDINSLRMRDFEYSTHNNLRLLPPSRDGLLEHFKRAAYEGGWVHYQCVENVELPPVIAYGRIRQANGRIVPKWCSKECDPLILTSVCTCLKAKCTSCNCAKKSPPLRCLPFCGCRGTCKYNSV